MIASIRDVELAMGDGRKVPAAEEIANRSIARRSLVAAVKIARRILHAQNVAVKRPGDGVSPEHYWEYLGRPADRDYAPDDMIAASSPTPTSLQASEDDRWKKSLS